MEARPLYQGTWEQISRFKPMVFVAGPRQCGKTTLARLIALRFTNSIYFNYDIIDDKARLIDDPLFYERLERKDQSTPLVVLDEIHKFREWKAYLKGVYDRDAHNYKFLVLGSGRLDTTRKAGDALVGRYLLFHLWPFTLAERVAQGVTLSEFLSTLQAPADEPDPVTREIWEGLLRSGGFPEPMLAGDENFYRMWSRSYREQLLREDIRSFARIQNLDQVALLLSLLPTRVGSPLSVLNLANDLKASHPAVSGWLRLFEHFYLVFQISPWTARVARAISKQKKIYLFDFGWIEDPGARFENAVALELLRAVSTWSDRGWGEFSLHYIRNKEGEEVDFVVCRGRKPVFLVETKLDDDNVGSALWRFQRALRTPAVQLVNRPGVCHLRSSGDQSVLVVSAERWLARLP